MAGMIASGAYVGKNDYARATKAAMTVPAMMMDEIQAPVISEELETAPGATAKANAPAVKAAVPAVQAAMPATKTSAPQAAPKGDSIAALIASPAATGDVGETQ
jgi:hypothetical protein